MPVSMIIVAAPPTPRRIGAIMVSLAALCMFPRAGAADNTGQRSPRVSSGQFSIPSNGLNCDELVAQANGNAQSQVFSLYGITVPAEATVTGIMVRVRARDGAQGNRSLQVSLSWDGGNRFSGPLQTGDFERDAPLRDYYVGGSRVLWGHAWTAADLSDRKFRVRLMAMMPGASDPIALDCPPVTVFYELPTPVPCHVTPEPSPPVETPTAPAR